MGLGRDGQLGIIMRSYRPNVTCGAALSRSLLVPESFSFLSTHFPATRERQVFGRALPGQGIDVKLPTEARAPFHLPARKAVSIIVRTIPTRDTSSWFDIYNALQAIWYMCGRAGSAGIADNIGIQPLMSPSWRQFGELMCMVWI